MNGAGLELNQHVSPAALELAPDPSSDTDGTIKRPAIETRMHLVEADIPEHRQEQAENFHRLYQAQSGQRIETIKRLYSELGEPKHLIVTLFCGKYLPLFENWLRSCSRNDIPVRHRTLAFCLDIDAATKSRNLGVQTYFIDPDVYPQAGHSDLFGDASFRRTMLYKNAVMLDALQLGARVLFQDTDLIWFKDPFVYLENENNSCDIQIMYDGPNGLYKPLHANTGFIYLQPNDATKAVLETALYNSASILCVGGHQFPFNKILNHFIRQRLLRLQVLPQRLFLNGHLFNLVRGVSPEAKNWEEDGIVLHYSWTGTMTEKFQKLLKFGLDFLGLAIDMKPYESELEVSGKSDVERGGTSGSGDEATEPGPGKINLTLYLAGQDALYLTCDQSAPILRILFNTVLGKYKSKRNSLIHLKIDDEEGSKDIYLRGAQINRIETEPPLTNGFLDSIGRERMNLRSFAGRLLKRSIKRVVFGNRKAMKAKPEME